MFVLVYNIFRYKFSIITMAKIEIILGSDSDLVCFKSAIDLLDGFGVPHKIHIASAHRSPEKVRQILKEAESGDTKVLIAAAGMAAHLPGVVASQTLIPVIGVPIGKSFDGMDALLSIVQMPTGYPVATVAVDAAQNAILLALQIMANEDLMLHSKLVAYRQSLVDIVEKKDKELQLLGVKGYLAKYASPSKK